MSMEAYQFKLPLLLAIPDNLIVKPRVSIRTIVMEAENLVYRANQDRHLLAAANFDITLIDDLPVRAAALREAEAIWNEKRITTDDTWKELNKQISVAKELLKKIKKSMQYAFGDRPDLLKTLQSIHKNSRREMIIQNLNDLSILGNQNEDLLKAINFKTDLLVQATKLAPVIAQLLASAKGNKTLIHTRNIRDRAYTHLKMAMAQIRHCGRYVFAQDKERLRGYICQYNRIHRKKTV